jgi:alpha-N-arabinofuranosidase
MHLLRIIPPLFALLATAGVVAPNLSADEPAPVPSQLLIHADQPGGTISRDIYGQFAEHLGRSIYEGIWVGEDSPIPNTRGIRNDVVAALKEIKVPVLRWPGGCFADEYHWKDGIGPREKRPSMINTHWGGTVENNHFGTHEFFDLCEQLGADAYVCGNLGSGTPQEMMEWVEYMTSAADSPMAKLRRQNGRDKPWKLKFFGVGNESWGCGGNMRPGFYADNFRRYNTFVKNYSGNTLQRIACGANDEDYDWTDVLMSIVGPGMNGLSLHYYTLSSGVWAKKGPATGFPKSQWHSTLWQASRMDEIVSKHAAIMDHYDPQKKVGLVVDEWGTWYDVEPGTNPGFLYQQNTIRDALVAAITLDIFQKHCDRIMMANIAQMVDVLQSMILTDKEKMILTPTYHVFDMYKVHQDATFLPVDVTAPDYTEAGQTIPSLHASASRDKAGRVHLSIVNLQPQQSAQVIVKLAGATLTKVEGQILTAAELDAHNTFDAPENVHPVAFTAFVQKGGSDELTLTLPAKSVVVLGL